MIELYKKYRPSKLSEIVGQDEAVASLKGMLAQNKLPHTILFTGPSGVGKTTLARILKNRLKCSDIDFNDVNCASIDGVLDVIRGIQARMTQAPLAGPCRIWLLDEVQSLTRATYAQQAMLKILEDTPKHVYFFLCTTDPGKLLTAIRSRSTEVKLKSVGHDDLYVLLKGTLDKEGTKVSDAVVEKIIEAAEGGPRKAMVLLHQVLGVEDEIKQLELIEKSDTKNLAITLARSLVCFPNKRPPWPRIGQILKDIEGEDCEQIRHLILSYARSVILKGGGLAPVAADAIDCFETNLQDSKHAGLALMCWKLFHRK